MKKEIQNTDERNIVRNNKLINGKVKLKAKSYDLIRAFSSLVDYNDTDFWTYTLKVSDLGIDYKRAKEYIRDIMRNPIEIKDDSKLKFDCFAWCSTMKYENGYIEAKLNPDLKDFMLQIKGNYTKTFEKYIMPMDSIYAKRIYEMLIQNEDYGYRKFNLEELQEVLDVPKSMRNYANFKKYVLVIAIKEINKHTDIYLPIDTENLKDTSWKRLQCGLVRKVSHLNFEFRKKSDKGLFTKEADKYQMFKVEAFYLEKIEDELDYETNELMKELREFLYFCKREKKEYKNMSKSFYIHLKKKRELNI